MIHIVLYNLYSFVKLHKYRKREQISGCQRLRMGERVDIAGKV